MKMKAEIKLMFPQAKEHQNASKPQQLGERPEINPPFQSQMKAEC